MSLKVSRTGQVALPTGFLIAATAASNSVPLPTPSSGAKIIEFKPRERDREAYQEARIRYLRSIISDQSKPFNTRMDALAQVAMIDRKRA